MNVKTNNHYDIKIHVSIQIIMLSKAEQPNIGDYVLCDHDISFTVSKCGVLNPLHAAWTF